MEDWVYRALAKWPNVPALFGWLSLDRRGRWRIRDEVITRPQIIDTINPNYAPDEHGRWYFQNGPQRGYVSLASAPLVLRVDANGHLHTHTGREVEYPTAAYLDEQGSVFVQTEHGPSAVDDNDLEWVLQHLSVNGQAIDDAALTTALAQTSGSTTALQLQLGPSLIRLQRLDFAEIPDVLGFIREPRTIIEEK
ncbi:DUF2946 family protein [Sinimarinibacterium sp. CAU 1509]|uniref:DUF2946 family protein n=1 Tax=Sinimarinibacterium sp. CAU 1509 TaxID=2562283 RepID=UPI0010AC09F6|nr:DUF2946 family protein [Sinimarinibacterium sp. CAU 1509]TJY65001.1 DUF2946 family protein [Sinimarinibacterium sp. CAU 1509]